MVYFRCFSNSLRRAGSERSPTYLTTIFEYLVLSNRSKRIKGLITIRPLSPRFSFSRNYADANFRSGEMSQMRIFAQAKFHGELSSNFRENKGRNSANFAFIYIAQKKLNPVRLINFQRMGAKSEKGSWTNGASKYSGYTNL